MDLLEFMMEIDIVMPFTIELDVLKRGVKRDVIYVFFFFFHYFAKIKVDSDNFANRKKLTLRNVIIHIKLALNKDQNHHYKKNFLENCSYQLAKK